MKNWRPVLAWVYFGGFVIYIIYRWNQLSLEPGNYLKWGSLLVLLLTVVLLLIEAQKWRILVSNGLWVQEATKQVMAGFSTAIFSPGQFGHFIGRKVLHSNLGWWNATGATLLGGFWQTLSFVVFGAVSLWLLVLPIDSHAYMDYLKYAALVLIVLFLIGLRFITMLHEWLNGKSWSANKYAAPIVNILAAVRYKSLHENVALFGLSSVKSLIIYIQFAFLIYISGDLHIDLQVFYFIPIVFLILTLLPLPSMLGLIARGEIVLQLWKIYNLDAEKAYISVYTLWAFNIMVPAIIGAMIILAHQKKLNI